MVARPICLYEPKSRFLYLRTHNDNVVMPIMCEWEMLENGLRVTHVGKPNSAKISHVCDSFGLENCIWQLPI